MSSWPLLLGKSMRVIIAGSRDIDDIFEVLDAVKLSGFNITRAVCGMAKGVDTLGEEYAIFHDIPIDYWPANWQLYKAAAGAIRNEQMARNADALIAVWDGRSPGTKNMIKIAKALGLKVYIHNASNN